MPPTLTCVKSATIGNAVLWLFSTDDSTKFQVHIDRSGDRTTIISFDSFTQAMSEYAWQYEALTNYYSRAFAWG